MAYCPTCRDEVPTRRPNVVLPTALLSVVVFVTGLLTCGATWLLAPLLLAVPLGAAVTRVCTRCGSAVSK